MRKTFAKLLLDKIPRVDVLHKIANRYIDHFNNDNNSDFSTNGESRLIRCAIENNRPKFTGGGLSSTLVRI